MIFTGYLLHLWQTCRRKFLLESIYRRLKWHPQVLFSACLRKAVFDLSSGKDKHQASTSAVNYFISNVKHPGLDGIEGLDTYTLAMDFVATIRTIIEHLSRITLLTLRTKPNVQLSPGLDWSFLSSEDESGVLHRWKFVDYITEDNLVRELHSWELFGDLALSKSPMMLHLISIGRRESSHRISPWCRAYKSPMIANQYRFQKKGGNSLDGSWKPIWFSDNADNDPEVWVDFMLNDGVIESANLVRHVAVKEPNDVHIANFLRDLTTESDQIYRTLGKVRSDPFLLPLSRPACDTPYPCPHQDLCYSVNPSEELVKSGLYERRKTNLRSL